MKEWWQYSVSITNGIHAYVYVLSDANCKNDFYHSKPLLFILDQQYWYRITHSFNL